jgi:hypothetical protein
MTPEEHNQPTQLEMVTEAHMATTGAWLYPSDEHMREVAILACGNVGFDYIELVAETMEKATTADTSGVEQPGVDANTARHMVAESFWRLTKQLMGQGQVPRMNVTMEPVPPDTDPDDYGSLA